MTTEDVTINTEHMILRPLVRSDATALAALGTDEVFEMVPEIETPFDATAWIEHKLESEVPSICHVAILHDPGAAVGFIQVQIESGRSDYYLSTGYWFGSEHWGKGYATEALHAVIRHIAKEGRLRPLYAMVDRRNVASRRVLEKCGFSLSAETPNDNDSAGMQWYRWGPEQAP